jgi:hypothetical protein
MTILNMLTFFAALHHKWANSPSLKLSVLAIVDNRVIIVADLQRANDGDMKTINNCINPPNIPQIYNEHAHLLYSFSS